MFMASQKIGQRVGTVDSIGGLDVFWHISVQPKHCTKRVNFYTEENDAQHWGVYCILKHYKCIISKSSL